MSAAIAIELADTCERDIDNWRVTTREALEARQEAVLVKVRDVRVLIDARCSRGLRWRPKKGLRRHNRLARLVSKSRLAISRSESESCTSLLDTRPA